MATKNDIKFHTEVPDPSSESTDAAKKPLLKGLVYIALALALIYFARVSPPDSPPSRKHELLTWTFPTQQGISVLWALPDDGIDSNQVKTGHRIWIDPPKSPLKTLDNALRLSGPTMTAISEDITPSTIFELIQLLPHQGELQLWIPETDIPQIQQALQMNQSSALLTIQDTQQVQLKLFPLPINTSSIRFQVTQSENFTLKHQGGIRQVTLNYGDFKLLHHTHPKPPKKDDISAILFWNGAHQKELINWMENHIDETLVSFGENPKQHSDRHIILENKPEAALSFETDGLMKLRRVILDDWDTNQQ